MEHWIEMGYNEELDIKFFFPVYLKTLENQ